MIFDTHAHYDDDQFGEEASDLLTGLLTEGVGRVVNVGASERGCEASLELAHRYPFVYAACGIHPEYADRYSDELHEQLRKWLTDERCVALGEIGLDYHWEEPGRRVQVECFKRQLILAKESLKPVIIHSRDAAEETKEILTAYHSELVEASKSGSAEKIADLKKLAENPGVVHCFSYSREIAEYYVNLGFYIGIGGVLTFKNAKKLIQTAEAIPLESIVLETDCPYMAPEPYRGKRNYSGYLNYVAQKLADLKGVSKEEVIDITEKNAERLYRLTEA